MKEKGDANSEVQAGLLLKLKGSPLFWPTEQRKKGVSNRSTDFYG